MPASTNPTSGIRQSSKDPDLSCGLMERDTLARAVHADDVIVVFMDEEQRKIFRESGGAIIVSCVDQVHSTDGYNFLSVCVLDPQGEATPVCQAISANDFNTTARIMLETMKLLEPSMVCGIHCLMTSEILENPFIEALSQTLAPNSELSTYPLHTLCVESYEYTLQSHLKPISTRLDQLIYNVFKMNEFLQCKRDRFTSGFYGQIKSKIQLAFESMHETYTQKDTIRFEIVEAVTQDMGKNNSISEGNAASQYIEYKTWEISKYDGDVLLEDESHVVSAFPKGKTICQQKTCQVTCEKCVKESFGNLNAIAPKLVCGIFHCAHNLTCICSEFNANYNCIHVHIVNRHIMSKDSSFSESLAKINMSNSHIIGSKSNHDFVHAKNSAHSSLVQDTNVNDDGSFSKNIRPCAVKLQKLEDIDLNKALSTPYQRDIDSESQATEEYLLEEAINKLTSAARYLRKIKEKQTEIQGSENNSDKRQRKSSRKRKRPIIKNMCRDTIDYIDSNFPESIKSFREKIDKASENGDWNKSSTNIQTLSQGPQNLTSFDPKGIKTEGRKIKQGITQQVKEAVSKGSAYPHQIIGPDVPRKNLLRVALKSSVNDFSWCALICGHQEKNLEMLANLEDFDINEREIILEKFILAKSLWTCKKCKSFNSIESMLAGFVICKLCQHWFHRACCDGGENGKSQLEHLSNEFVCESCVSLFFEDVTQEPIQGGDIISTQGALQFQAVQVGEPVSRIGDFIQKIEGNAEAPPKLIQGEQIEFVQAQCTAGIQEPQESQISGPQIYYQLPPNASFPPSGEGHYVVQLQGDTVQQIGFEVL